MDAITQSVKGDNIAVTQSVKGDNIVVSAGNRHILIQASIVSALTGDMDTDDHRPSAIPQPLFESLHERVTATGQREGNEYFASPADRFAVVHNFAKYGVRPEQQPKVYVYTAFAVPSTKGFSDGTEAK